MIYFPIGIRRGNVLGVAVAVTWLRSDPEWSCACIGSWKAWSGSGPSQECNRTLIRGRFPVWLVTKYSGLETCGAVGNVKQGLCDRTLQGGPTRAGSTNSLLCQVPRSNPQWKWSPWNAAGPPRGQEGVPLSRVSGTLLWAGYEWVQWRYHSLTRSSHGSAWTQPPTQHASTLSPSWRRTDIFRRWTDVPLGKSRLSQENYVSRPMTVFWSWFAASRLHPCITPPGWPAPYQSPGHPGCLVSQWQTRVGDRAGGGAVCRRSDPWEISW